MLTNFQKVKAFHEVFDLLQSDSPNIPKEKEQILLRWKLIYEEYLELLDEFLNDKVEDLNYLEEKDIKNNIDLIKLTKEMCDLLYVIYGTGVAFGVDMDAAFAEVHRSNMSKLTKEGHVLRRDDGKVLKSDQYSPADIRKVLNNDTTGNG